MNPDEFFADIQRDSEARAANPLPFALDALEDLFAHRDDVDQGYQRFQRKLEVSYWWADDAVECLELVLADPPENLGKLVREQANVNVVRETENGLEVADDAGTEAWLRDEAVPRLRKQFDTYVADKTAEQLRARGDAPAPES
jgi:hypothetical protein